MLLTASYCVLAVLGVASALLAGHIARERRRSSPAWMLAVLGIGAAVLATARAVLARIPLDDGGLLLALVPLMLTSTAMSMVLVVLARLPRRR